MITGKLSNGFEVTVDETKIKTYRFTKIIGMAASQKEKERIYANAIFLSFLIGEEQEEKLLEYMYNDLGREAEADEVTNITMEILNLAKQEDEQIKKSASSDES